LSLGCFLRLEENGLRNASFRRLNFSSIIVSELISWKILLSATANLYETILLISSENALKGRGDAGRLYLEAQNDLQAGCDETVQ
jgi:hypothetical protein